jgi:hypothetical protein
VFDALFRYLTGPSDDKHAEELPQVAGIGLLCAAPARGNISKHLNMNKLVDPPEDRSFLSISCRHFTIIMTWITHTKF